MITKNPKNILLADDSAFFRIRLSTTLIEAGHEVTFASKGREVKGKLEAPDGFDLLILDLQMPRIDGFGVLEWMKESGYIGRFPTLAVTASYEQSAVVDRLRSLGASGLITKDFTPEQVIHCVNRMLFPEKIAVSVQPRAPLSALVDYTVEDETYTWSLLNISATGVFLRTRMNLFPGSVVGLKFSLPGSSNVYNIKGIVRWSTTPSVSKSLFSGAGIMFTSIAGKTSEDFSHFVERENKRLNLLQ
jgi:two-component system chemotaxis response regulator CheY